MICNAYKERVVVATILQKNLEKPTPALEAIIYILLVEERIWRISDVYIVSGLISVAVTKHHAPKASWAGKSLFQFKAYNSLSGREVRAGAAGEAVEEPC